MISSENNRAANSKKVGRKENIGEVIKDKMDKTVVVKVERKVTHPVYGKVVRKNRKFTAHNKDNAAKLGDKVRILECRPLSKTKRWKVVEVIK